MERDSAAEHITALTGAFDRMAGQRQGLQVRASGRAGPEGQLVDPQSSLEVELAPGGRDAAWVSLHVRGWEGVLRVWRAGATPNSEPTKEEHLDLDLCEQYRWAGILFDDPKPLADVLLRHLERRVKKEG